MVVFCRWLFVEGSNYSCGFLVFIKCLIKEEGGKGMGYGEVYWKKGS